MQTKTLAVCADDFGESEAKCDAILELARNGRISHTSCLTDAPLWRSFGPQLKDANVPLRIGLHFNLTLPFGHGEQPLPTWMLKAVLGTIDTTSVKAHLERQLAAFQKIIGRMPDFIDGHEHIHVFPKIRSVVSDVAMEVPTIPVRSLSHMYGRTDAPFKRMVIRSMAAFGGGKARRADDTLELNAAFAGDYSMRASAGYPQLFQSWIAEAPDGALIMCHPSITGRGAHEYRFLNSVDYLDALRAGNASR